MYIPGSFPNCYISHPSSHCRPGSLCRMFCLQTSLLTGLPPPMNVSVHCWCDFSDLGCSQITIKGMLLLHQAETSSSQPLTKTHTKLTAYPIICLPQVMSCFKLLNKNTIGPLLFTDNN